MINEDKEEGKKKRKENRVNLEQKEKEAGKDGAEEEEKDLREKGVKEGVRWGDNYRYAAGRTSSRFPAAVDRMCTCVVAAASGRSVYLAGIYNTEGNNTQIVFANIFPTT